MWPPLHPPRSRCRALSLHSILVRTAVNSAGGRCGFCSGAVSTERKRSAAGLGGAGGYDVRHWVSTERKRSAAGLGGAGGYDVRHCSYGLAQRAAHLPDPRRHSHGGPTASTRAVVRIRRGSPAGAMPDG